MCGIAGYFAASSQQSILFDESSLQSALGHRGPDGFGSVRLFDNRVGLFHSRLSIIDLTSNGSQPMLRDHGDLAITFNGEIYNYKELRHLLEADGFVFVSDSDTEVLLCLYEKLSLSNLGTSLDQLASMFLRSLNGIFAFSIWDSKRKSMLVARDAFGIKPLYVESLDSVVYFSSEIKALPCRSPSLDHISIERYLTFLWCPGDGSPISEVRKLSPGQAMWIANGQVQDLFSWYQSPFYRQSSFPKFVIPASKAVLETEHLLRQAVHRQLVADVPVGAFLSGGLDSSSVVSFARELNPDLRCFTIDVRGTSDEGFSDDLPYARRVAAHLGVSLDVVEVDATRMASDLEEMVWQLDEPLADVAPLNVLYISRLAREQGIKVLLSGAGGDDLFTGYRRHLALRSESLWGWMPRPLRIQLRELTGLLPNSHPFCRRLRKAFSGAHLEGDARLVHYFRWIERSDLHDLFTPSFRAALGNAQAEDPLFAFLKDLPQDTPPMDRMLALEQRFFLSDHNLNYTDKMSMAAGVEVRVPFLDMDLVDFAARIPHKYKQRGREGKWVLKKAMEPFLPHDVIYRPKSGFGAPLRSWFRGELHDWLADILSVERLNKRGLFDPQAVQRLILANHEGEVDYSYTLLSLACIEIWCKYFIDSKKPNTIIL